MENSYKDVLAQLQKEAMEFRAARAGNKVVEQKEKQFSPELEKLIDDGYTFSLDLAGEFQLVSGSNFFRDLEGNKIYKFPNKEEVKSRIENDKENFELKLKQYENPKIFIVPLLEPKTYFSKLRQVMLKYDRQDLLHSINKDGSKYKITSKGKNQTLNKDEPIWNTNKYNKKDNLIYDPQSFDKNHNDKTKAQILEKNNGFSVILVEDIELKRENQGKEINGRKQIEANQTLHKYLEILKTDPEYKGEVGLYPEESLFRMLADLKDKDGLVRNDWQGKGCLEGSLGAYFSASGSVPCLYFSRVFRQAFASGWDPSYSDDDVAVSFAVRV